MPLVQTVPVKRHVVDDRRMRFSVRGYLPRQSPDLTAPFERPVNARSSAFLGTPGIPISLRQNDRLEGTKTAHKVLQLR
jgi:hypothetical protein